jgi:hypothetical protein
MLPLRPCVFGASRDASQMPRLKTHRAGESGTYPNPIWKVLKSAVQGVLQPQIKPEEGQKGTRVLRGRFASDNHLLMETACDG